ncbi:MAG: acetyl-CoA carboxylase biotin carboxyl carrier protein [Planctomycetaceae bacterium]|nr:acetyl-CoA carboxylase biotin carboxyl carrier protein [Planctomycetaceae bacterium]
MSKSSSGNQSFDLDKLKELIEMMEDHGVTEVNLRHGDEQWRLRRGPAEVVQMVPQAPAPQAPAAAPTPPPAAPAGGGESAAPAAPEGPVIKAPTVGTFYSSPSPDDPPFVKNGSKVSPDTTVCLIEAMKVFNPIEAEVSGTITEILVQDGEAVEFGQPLFRYQP